jgi:hypothetical protein
MRARTEDLLKIRDGEPLDAAVRERIAADRENLLEIERLSEVAEALRRLPVIDPPPGVWARVAATAEPPRRRLRRAAGITVAIAASAAAAALLIARSPQHRDAAAPPQPAAASTAVSDVGYASLVAESVRLERLLSEFEHRPRLMNAATASTIADLEDHIVLLDEQLSFAAASGVDPFYRQALWRERVDVMNALLHVRYAHYRGAAE